MASLKEWMSQRRVRGLMVGLRSPNRREREEAILGLTVMGPSAVSILVAEMASGSQRSRAAAAVVLGRLRSVSAIPTLAKALGDGDVEVREDVEEALEEIGAPAVPELITRLLDADPRIRTGAAQTLGRIRDPRAVSSLARMVGDPDMAICQAAVTALGDIGDGSVVPLVAGLLEDERPTLRQCALTALDKIGTPQALAVVKDWREQHR
jgi:HEAT repeat protein